MNIITKSYIAYTRGERKISPWAVLKPLGWGGTAIVWARRALYDHGIYASEEAPIPVISVGNLTTGGTNKTPFVEYIAGYFCDAGLKPGIISRGYGGKTQKPVVMQDGNVPRSVVGDEPLLLSRHLPSVPIAVSRDRVADVKALLNYDVDVVIADDAFQHRRLARELDIVLLDPICPFGNGSPLPSGILRELPSSLSRAHIVVITKADQATQEQLDAVTEKIAHWVPRDKIFYSRLGPPKWAEWDGKTFRPLGENNFDNLCINNNKVVADTERWDGKTFRPLAENDPDRKSVILFSAIGSPRSFRETVATCGLSIAGEISFKDHHHYSAADLHAIEEKAQKIRADALCCTEKDIFNLPNGYIPRLPLIVPRISTQIDGADRFWKNVTETLRPRIIIASNGNGEDAIGTRLAQKLRAAFAGAQIEAFPLVGQGEPYKNSGIPIDAPLLKTPTGGIIKYHLGDLVQELRAGLLRHIRNQFREWKKIRATCRTVLCVGDAYLVCHTLWGQGKKALLVATAKTQFISGHWKLESFIYRRVCVRVWTRDEETAVELRRRGVPATYDGNPIMDLLSDTKSVYSLDSLGHRTRKINLWGNGRRILILPGSRSRAYKDLGLLLASLKLISQKFQISAVLVVAPSLDLQKLVDSAEGWSFDGEKLSLGNLNVSVHCGEVSTAAPGAELLLGLGGTANQVCAGMGIPVLSIMEKGKLVQKKLLGDAELLVPPDPEKLAAAAISLLNDPSRLAAMSEAGVKRLGRSGSLDAVVQYAAKELGWRKKCALYENLKASLHKSLP